MNILQVSHFKLSTTTFAWFNAEVMQKLSLLYIVKLLIPETSQGFPES